MVSSWPVATEGIIRAARTAKPKMNRDSLHMFAHFQLSNAAKCLYGKTYCRVFHTNGFDGSHTHPQPESSGVPVTQENRLDRKGVYGYLRMVTIKAISSMIRILSVIMAVVITASPAAVAGLLGPPCEDHPCCCHGPPMDMHHGAIMKIQSDSGCCCQPDGDIPCTLASNPLPNTLERAISSSRIHIPTPVVSGNATLLPVPAFPEGRIPQHIRTGEFKSAAPPAYLSHMSFIC